MNLNLLSLAIVAGFTISSCNSTKSTTGNEAANSVEKVTDQVADADVPYVVAANYFVKNTHKNDTVENLKITTQEQFDNVFGMATTMGEGGKPTQIDFSKQFVLAVIGTVTNKETDFAVNGLVKKDDDVTFSYTETIGKEMSFTIQPSLAVIVDKSYDGTVKFEKK